MQLTIANVSTINDDTLNAAVAAIGLQVSRDFQPEWNVVATLSVKRIYLGNHKVHIDTAAQAIIYLGDSAEDPTSGVEGALGYHAVSHAEIPYGFVYLDICEQYQEDWTTTLSHEVLELLADPPALRTVPGPVPHGSQAAGPTAAYDLEVCDPTQGDTYQINNVTVSNFVNRCYFGLQGTSQGTNFQGLALDPFGVRPGGYFQYEDGANVYQVQGTRVPASRIATREKYKRFRRNGRRETRLKGEQILPR